MEKPMVFDYCKIPDAGYKYRGEWIVIVKGRIRAHAKKLADIDFKKLNKSISEADKPSIWKIPLRDGVRI